MSQMPNTRLVCIVLFVVVFAPQAYVSAGEEPNLLAKLDCQPAEKRIFDYESNTQLWGPLDENFVVRADIIVHCLGNDQKGKYGTNGLKYMVQIENLKPSVVKEKQNEIKRRTKRGVGSWFQQAWVDVKDFFVNLFSKRNKKQNDEFDFDFERQPSGLQYQCKGKGNRRKRAAKAAKYEPLVYDKMFSTPFVFIQLSDGSIPEVRFSDKETDPSVKNFKRHIADAFATQLDASKQRVLEQSPIGAHFSSYSFDNSGKLEESLQPTADGQSLKLGASFMSLSQIKGSEKLSVMRDIAPEDMMEIGSNAMPFDSKQLGVNAKQITQISEGRVTTTAGHLSLSLVNPKNSRNRRDVNSNNNIEDYLKVKTKYSLSMTKRIAKRSTDEKQNLETLMQIESKLNLKGEAIVSESTTENTLRERLSATNRHITSLIGSNRKSDHLLKYATDHQNPMYSSLMNALNLEVMLNQDKSSSSVTQMINDKIDERKVTDICGPKLSLKNTNCLDLLMLLVRAQSRLAQTLLIKQLDSGITAEEKNEILKLLVQSPDPDRHIIDRLIQFSKIQSNKDLEGSLLLAIGNLGYHSKSVQTRETVADLLITKLNQLNCHSDENNSLLIDTLEAIGNLGHKSTISYSQKFGDICLNSDAVRIAAIHSCRRLIANPEVEKWFLKLLKEPTNSCVIKQEVVNALIEDIGAQEISVSSVSRWPKVGFNEIDNILSENLIQIKHNECLQENIFRYYERKNSDYAKSILKKAKKHRSKREVFDSFWTESYCKEFVPNEAKKETPIGGADTVVISDRMRESEDQTENAIYEKRRKCSATKRIGPSQAQAVFRADIVNDLAGPEDYKLMAQFVAGTHFLGTDIDIGKMYAYHKKNTTRAYVSIFGNTLVDAVTTDCNGQNLQPYMTSNYLPLYDFSLWIVQMTLGVRMDAEMNLDLPKFNCQDNKAAQIKILDFKPETKVKAAGEVSGKVLVIRGGMNVGGDFNYFSNLKFEPSPELCLSVYNGYNPMNVSITSWYQFWHPTCNEWMTKNVWSPVALNWQVNDHHRSAWLENECLIRDAANAKSDKRFDP